MSNHATAHAQPRESLACTCPYIPSYALNIGHQVRSIDSPEELLERLRIGGALERLRDAIWPKLEVCSEHGWDGQWLKHAQVCCARRVGPDESAGYAVDVPAARLLTTSLEHVGFTCDCHSLLSHVLTPRFFHPSNCAPCLVSCWSGTEGWTCYRVRARRPMERGRRGRSFVRWPS